MTDSRGGNVFHLATYMNKPQILELLRPETEKMARDRDYNGDLPIYIASKMGHIEPIEKLHPASQLENRGGQTVLHVAAKYGRSSAVRYMLRHPDLGNMINDRDHAGNTPLHLAAMHSQPATLIHLLLDERVRPFLLNHNNLTAFDIALNRAEDEPTFRKLLAFTVLESSPAVSRDLILQMPEAGDREFPRLGLHMELTKEAINSPLLVATLVANVSYIAGLTVPGVLNGTETSSKYDRGMATLLDKKMFQAFIICNTIAVFSSMVVEVRLMAAQQWDFRTAINVVQQTRPLLAIALVAMYGAFLTGVNLTVGRLSSWLAHTLFCLGIIGLLIVSVAKLLEYSYFYRSHRRSIHVVTSWVLLVFIHYYWGVETDISDDLEDDGKGELDDLALRNSAGQLND